MTQTRPKQSVFPGILILSGVTRINVIKPDKLLVVMVVMLERDLSPYLQRVLESLGRNSKVASFFFSLIL